jgi:hypothetical protein
VFPGYFNEDSLLWQAPIFPPPLEDCQLRVCGPNWLISLLSQ